MVRPTQVETIRALASKIQEDNEFVKSKLETARAGGLSTLDHNELSAIINRWSPLYEGRLDLAGMDEAELDEIDMMLSEIKRNKMSYLTLLIIFARTESTSPVLDVGTAISRLRSSILVNDAITLADNATKAYNSVLQMNLPPLRRSNMLGPGGRLADKIRMAFQPDRNVSNSDECSLFSLNVNEAAGIVSIYWPGAQTYLSPDDAVAFPSRFDNAAYPRVAEDYNTPIPTSGRDPYDQVAYSGRRDNKLAFALYHYDTHTTMSVDHGICARLPALAHDYVIRGHVNKLKTWKTDGSEMERSVDVKVSFKIGGSAPAASAGYSDLNLVGAKAEPKVFNIHVPANTGVWVSLSSINPQGVQSATASPVVGGSPIFLGISMNIDEVCWAGGGRVVYNGGELLATDKRLGDLHGKLFNFRSVFDSDDLQLLEVPFLYNEYIRNNWGVGIADIMRGIFKRRHPLAPNGREWIVTANPTAATNANAMPDDSFFLAPINYFTNTTNSVYVTSQSITAYSEFLKLWSADDQRRAYGAWLEFMMMVADFSGGDGQFEEYLRTVQKL
jgi:hypothetical protein